MLLANKQSFSRPISIVNDINVDDSYYTPPAMDMYAGSEARARKTRSKVGLRKRASFFSRESVGSGSSTKEVESEGSDVSSFGSPTKSEFPIIDEKDSLVSRAGRRLRKSSSKTSLYSLATGAEDREEKHKSRIPWSHQNRPRNHTITGSISRPFDFEHITHADQKDVRVSGGCNALYMMQDWTRIVESRSRPGTAETCNTSTPSGPMHLRSQSSTDSFSLRSRASSFTSLNPGNRARSNSTLSALARESISASDIQLTAPETQDLPLTPPARNSSRFGLDVLEEAEDDTGFNPDNNGDAEMVLDAAMLLGQALTTDEAEELDYSDFPAVPSQQQHGLMTPPDDDVLATSEETSAVAVPAAEESSTKPSSSLSIQARPQSQLSHVSDTLNGNWVLPGSPAFCTITRSNASIRSRRMSKIMSGHARSKSRQSMLVIGTDFSGVDSWENDIDWCYEHEADADCDFNWDKESSYAGSTPGDLVRVSTSEPTGEDLLQIPELSEDPELNDMALVVGDRNDRRITGVFEDRLLLPPSPQFPTPPEVVACPPSPTWKKESPRDSGFEADSQSAILKAARTVLRHRSSSVNSNVPGDSTSTERKYREELHRVAQELDAHIAALNTVGRDSYQPPSLRSQPSYGSLTQGATRTRARADSEATVATLCSDTFTITPTDTNEAVTPASSAHNSLLGPILKKGRASMIGGCAIEGRSEKGLSFSPAIPGVVEVAPGGLSAGVPDVQEYVYYI